MDGKYATLAAYVIGTTDSDTVALLSSDTTYAGAGISPNTLDYGSFAQSSGIVIEAFSGADGYTTPAGHTIFASNGGTRDALTGTFTDVTSLTTDYVIGGTTKNSRTAGMAFEAIPEPATLGMVAAVGGALLFMRRRFII